MSQEVLGYADKEVHNLDALKNTTSSQVKEIFLEWTLKNHATDSLPGFVQSLLQNIVIVS
jgi:hypothetical protein